MREHERFGRPPTLRPRSAASGRSSGAPDLVVADANTAGSSPSNSIQMQLLERIQSPRTGIPGSTASKSALCPSSKPPMRPKTAAIGSRHASRQRLERTHTRTEPSNENAPTVDPTITKIHEGISAACTFSTTLSNQRIPAAATSSTVRKRPSSAAVSSFNTQSSRLQSNNHNVIVSTMPPVAAKRPCSAGPTIAHRPQISMHSLDTKEFQSPSDTSAMLYTTDITRTEHRNTFAYAVPRHCLNPRLRYNPYDIVTVSRATLFESNQTSSETSNAKWDYYTVSGSGFTFYPKNDAGCGIFHSIAEWEIQRKRFDEIASKTTFELFRYRKVFMVWKKWIRATKMETARVHLILEGYFSHPPLFRATVCVRNQLRTLESSLFDWDFGGEGISLTMFNQANQRYLDYYSKLIHEVHTGIQKTLVNATREYLDDPNIRETDSSLPGDEFAKSSRKCSNYQLYDLHVESELKLATADIQHMNHEHFRDVGIRQHPRTVTGATRRSSEVDKDVSRIRWTLAAIKRRKCRQLAQFTKLVALLELDTFETAVRRNANMVYHSLLRGANSCVIRRLTLRHTYEEAIRSMDRDIRNDTTPEKTRRTSIREVNAQQLKRLLRSVWETAFHSVLTSCRVGQGEDAPTFGIPNASGEIWDQSKFEAVFFEALSICRDNVVDSFVPDTYSIDEVLNAADTIIGQALALQVFINDPDNLYRSEEPSIDVNDSLEQHQHADTMTFDEKVRSIVSISPVPLFSLSLELSQSGPQDFQIGINPPLREMVDAIHTSLTSFLELFKDVSSVASHPTLRAVILFAEDLQTSDLVVSDEISKRSVSFITTDTNAPQGLIDKTQIKDIDDVFSYEHLVERIQANRLYQSTCSHINKLIDQTIKGVSDLAEWYIALLEQHVHNLSVNFEEKAQLFQSGAYSLIEVADDIRGYQVQTRALERLRQSHNVQFVTIDIRDLATALLPAPTKCLDTMHAMLPVLAHEKCSQLLDFVAASTGKIQKPLRVDIVEFTHYLIRLQKVYDAIDQQESSLVFVQDLFALLGRFLIHVPEETTRIFELCDPEFSALRSHAQDAYSSRESDIGGYHGLLNEHIASLLQSTRDLQSRASDAAELDEDSYDKSFSKVVSLDQQAALMREQSELLTWSKTVFAETSSAVTPPSDEFAELEELADHLKLKVELWSVLCEASNHMQSASCQTIQLVDIGRMTTLCERIRDVIHQIKHVGADTFVVERLRGVKHMFEALAPIIRDMRNPHMKERHWTKLERRMNCSLSAQKISDLTTDETNQRLMLPLQRLIDVDAAAYATGIRHVSEEATAEAAVADSFDSVSNTWDTKEIPIESRKDRDGRETLSIGDCGELVALLEESEVLLRVMDFSSYARSIQEKLTKMLSDLELTKAAMDLLQICQHRWNHTQKLFSADFVRSFPEQARLLQKHDTSWRAFMASLSKRSLCLPFGVSAEARHLLLELVKGFEISAKALIEHLEMKREVFPAFFRLSNTELATLLSRSRDVHDIQPYLYQCFDNVGRIVFGARESFQDIHSIISRSIYGQPESIDMGNNLKARGPPEQWLSAVEKRLGERLRRNTKQAIVLLSQFKSGYTDPKPSDLVLFEELPLQSILLADRIVRGAIINECLSPSKDTEMQATTTNQVGTCNFCQEVLKAYGDRLISYVSYHASPRNQRQQHNMQKRAMVILSCLRLHDIQFRDAIDLHFSQCSRANVCDNSNTATAESIPWDLQVRYSLDDANTVGQECLVQVGTTIVPYGFNYIDPTQESIITLQSMRSLFSLASTIRNGQGSFLIGQRDSGTGQLAAQVSTVLGRRLFTTITTTTTTYSHISRLLAGALCSGGIFYLNVSSISECSIGMVKLLGTFMTAVQQAVLSDSPIEGVHRSSIAFTPGTMLLVSLNRSLTSQFTDEDVRQWAESMRVIDVLPVDQEKILEAILYANNFVQPRALSKCLATMTYHVTSVEHGEMGAHVAELFSTKSLKYIIDGVTKRMQMCDEEFERAALEYFLIKEALLEYVQQHLRSKLLCDAVSAVVATDFDNATDKNEWFVKQFERHEAKSKKHQNADLIELLQASCAQLHLAPRKQLIDAAMSIFAHVDSLGCVVLIGDCGTGKTTAYQVLAKALGIGYELKLERQQVQIAPDSVETITGSKSSQPLKHCATNTAVSIRLVLPRALTTTQLYGSAFTEHRKDAPSSVLGRLIREAQEMYIFDENAKHNVSTLTPESEKHFHQPTKQQLWIVFDGSIEACWAEILVQVSQHQSQRRISGNQSACRLFPFQNGEFMTFPPNLRFLFESNSLETASPPLIFGNGIVHFEATISCDSNGSENEPPIHVAFLRSYFRKLEAELQSGEGSIDGLTGQVTRVLNVIEQRVLDSDLLERILLLTEEYETPVSLSRLHRTQSFASLLRSTLSNAIAFEMKKETPVLISFLPSSPESELQPKSLCVMSTRMGMSLAYSLIWGLAMCTNDSPQLQVLVSNTVKNAIPEAAVAWMECSQELNLYDAIVDFEACRFVNLDDKNIERVARSTRCGSADLTANRDKKLGGSFGSFSPAPASQVFIPTRSSITVHSALKAGLRTGQIVLLVGSDGSRRTTLLQNFMQQSIRSNPLQHTKDLVETIKEHKSEEQTLESVNRIRFHQISLVMLLAARFCRESEKSSTALTVVDVKSALNQTSKDGACKTFRPTWSFDMAEAIERLDCNEVIPFFFGMTQHDKGATEIIKCMERMLQRERTDVFEPPPGKAALLIIDDLHLHSEHMYSNTIQLKKDYPNTYETLRSVCEHGTVFVKDSGSSVHINNLLLLCSANVFAFNHCKPNVGRYATVPSSQALHKLVQRCFLCIAPSCSSVELCSVFSAVVSAQFDKSSGDLASRLPASIKHDLPVIVAATIVLWESFRKEIMLDLQVSIPRYSLHDLARVFEGICRVDAAIIEDSETLLRLWVHECTRTFDDQLVGGPAEKDRSSIIEHILSVKDTLAQAKQLTSRPSQSQANERMSISEAAIGDPMRAEAYLPLLLSEVVVGATSTSAQQLSQTATRSPRRSRITDTRSQSSIPHFTLWSFAPEVIFFDRRPATPSRGRPQMMAHRSSRLLLREASCEFGSRLRLNTSPSGGWIYGELVNGDIDNAVQKFFGWITTTSCTMPDSDSVSPRWSIVPPDSYTPPVPFPLAHTMARIERVKGRAPTRIVLLGSPGSGRESLLKCLNLSWQSHHRHRILTFAGFAQTCFPSSDAVINAKWQCLLAEIYERVGMNCENVTLVVKNLHLVPPCISSQLLSLMSTGDVTSAFTVDEQIRMATRLRDERILEIEGSHNARIAQIHSSIKRKREEELEAARVEERESQQVLLPQFFEELEKKYNDLLKSQLAQARLWYQQEMEDFIRRREVETESLTTTIMSLMRPLGITSGKWQQIVNRIRKRLAVVVVIDHANEALLRTSNPQIFSMCSVIGVPPLGFDALRVLAYGHLLAEVHSMLPTVVNTLPTKVGNVSPAPVPLAAVKPLIWALAAMASDMHIAVTQACRDLGESSNLETKMLWSMLSHFTKLLIARSRDIEALEAKCWRFIAAVERMESALFRLRDSDVDLPDQIVITDTEIDRLQKKASEQNDDTQRIREIMLRFQDAAEEQVRITNEMQDQAQKELQIPLACVDEANKALMLIDKRHVVEIKSFTSPPLLVHLVLDAICVLFRYEPTWDNARKVLSDPNVVQTLLTFDKDAIPVDILQKLERDFLSDERFNRLDVEKQSVAASMMVIWVRSIHQYASARLLVKPTLDKLEKAQSRLKLLMQEFQVSKDRVAEAEVMWKASMAQLKALEQQKSELEARKESRTTRLESGQLAFEYVEEDRLLTRATLDSINGEKLASLAWWNSLIHAGTITYTGLLPHSLRTKVFGQWKESYERWGSQVDAEDSPVRCLMAPSLCVFPLSALAVDEDLSGDLKNQESSDLFETSRADLLDHLRLMNASGSCISFRRLHDVSLLSRVATTPHICTMLITQYNDEAETLIDRCVAGVWHWASFKKIQAYANDFDTVLGAAIRYGHQLLVLDINPSDALQSGDRVGAKAVLDWQVKEIAGCRHLMFPVPCSSSSLSTGVTPSSYEEVEVAQEERSIPIHPSFRLILASPLGPASFVGVTDHITLDAALRSDEVDDAALDEQWFQERAAASDQPEGQAADSLGSALDRAVEVLGDQEVAHEQLVELVEEAANATDFQVALMDEVRAQCMKTKGLRLDRQRALLDVQQQVDALRSGETSRGEPSEG